MEDGTHTRTYPSQTSLLAIFHPSPSPPPPSAHYKSFPLSRTAPIREYTLKGEGFSPLYLDSINTSELRNLDTQIFNVRVPFLTRFPTCFGPLTLDYDLSSFAKS